MKFNINDNHCSYQVVSWGYVTKVTLAEAGMPILFALDVARSDQRLIVEFPSIKGSMFCLCFFAFAGPAFVRLIRWSPSPYIFKPETKGPSYSFQRIIMLYTNRHPRAGSFAQARSSLVHRKNISNEIILPSSCRSSTASITLSRLWWSVLRDYTPARNLAWLYAIFYCLSSSGHEGD